mgnify:CR=1 FL=1
MLQIIEGESPDKYHSMRGEYITSSNVKDYLQCPLTYVENLRWRHERQTPAMELGTAFHCRLLEGVETFAARYFTGGPINERTGKTYGSETAKFKEWEEANAVGGKKLLSEENFGLIGRMLAAVETCPHAKMLLNMCDKRELTMRGDIGDNVNAGRVKVQARLDACGWGPQMAAVMDIKTCDSLDGFERDITTRGYFIQLEMYGVMLSEAVKIDGAMIDKYIVAVEKSAPNRCCVWKVDVPAAAKRIRRAFGEIATARMTGVYHHKYEELRNFVVKPWVAEQWGLQEASNGQE